jgi:BirA family biotin operon repressor/biotin-[acetyl-CoA-carboxylase] ligase
MDRDELRPPLDAAALSAEVLGTESAWRQLDVVTQTGSTNADLLERAAEGADIGGAILIAEHQTAGRGRHGRGWSTTPRAQISMSIGVSVAGVPVGAWGWLSLAAGVAIVDAVAPLLEATGSTAGLKWPNDVLAGPPDDQRKLAGILAQTCQGAQPFVVIGLGLNVTQVPEAIEGPGATSLVDLGVRAPDRGQLVRGLLAELGTRIAGWRAAGGADPRLAADYRARSLTIGSRVRVELPGGREVVGTAGDIDDQGRLCVKTEGDPREIAVVSAGDVVHLRLN